MESILGTTFGIFFSITVVIMGFAAFVTGHAIAAGWRPIWQGIFYCALMGLADRFFTFSLFDGVLVSLSGYLIDTAVLIAIFLIGYRLTRAKIMVDQYPWLYERTGPFSWRQREGGAS